MNSTINFYNENASEYIESTLKVDMSTFCNRFLPYVKGNGKILDLGCGAGRDSRFFLDKGYDVVALDASEKMCNYVKHTLNIPVYNITFDQMNFENAFDGIWACASLLHVDYKEIDDIFEKIRKALKENGVLFACFKYGDNERQKGERKFFDYTEKSIKELVYRHNFKIEEIWQSENFEEKWINIIVKNEDK